MDEVGHMVVADAVDDVAQCAADYQADANPRKHTFCRDALVKVAQHEHDQDRQNQEQVTRIWEDTEGRAGVKAVRQAEEITQSRDRCDRLVEGDISDHPFFGHLVYAGDQHHDSN